MTTMALVLPERRRLFGMAIPFVAVIGSMALGLLLIAIGGKDVADAIDAFLDGAFGSAFAIGASINRAVALSLVGLGFILAFRANLTNVGGEGQIAVGGIAATALALWPPIAALPLGLAVILPLLGGTFAGAIWGGIAGFMKVRFGTNEVISTLLLGFVALLMVYWCVQSTALLRQPQTSSATLPESLPIPDATKLPSLTGDPESPLHIGLVICLVLAVATAIVLQRSTFGVRLRAIGLNELAARRAGMPGGTLLVIALALAGAFGGLAGAIMLQGEQYYLKTGFSSGYGFDGLVVGLLSRGSTLGVLAGALFFGFLRSGGISMEIMAGVPAALTLVIQGLIVIAVAGSVILVEKLEEVPLMDTLAVFIASTVRLAMPLMLAASGELVSERAGVLNLSLEGMMLTAAFFGALGSWATGSPYLGVACAIAAALCVSAVQAWLSVNLRANQLVVGIGFNILALGATTLLYRLIFGGLSREEIPGLPKLAVTGLSDLPFAGVAFLQQSVIVYVGLALIVLIWWGLNHTAFGLAVRAVGDEPRSADKAGIPVARTRWLAVLVAGFMAGVAGAFISIADIHTFTENMTNGAGYLALAAVIFGGWNVGRTVAACLLFGAATALQFQLPAMGIDVPTAFLLMLPYLLALLAVAGVVGRLEPPTALTLPFQRGK